MPKFAANLTMLFNEVPIPRALRARARGRLRGGRISLSLRLTTPEVLKRGPERNGLVQVLHNLPAGDWGGGERGIAILPDRIDEFRRGVATGDRLCDGAWLQAGQLPRRHRPEWLGATTSCAQPSFDNLRLAATGTRQTRHPAAD